VLFAETSRRDISAAHILNSDPNGNTPTAVALIELSVQGTQHAPTVAVVLPLSLVLFIGNVYLYLSFVQKGELP
jgi:hypothetical protein